MSETRAPRRLLPWLAAAAALGATLLLDGVLLRAVPAIEGFLGATPSPLRTSLMRWLGLFHLAGNVEPWLFVAFAFALAKGRGTGCGKRAARVLLLLASVVVAGLGSEGLKLVVRRERPGTPGGGFARRPFAVETWRTSPLTFPSGHAAVAAAGSTAVAALCPAAAPAMAFLAGGCGVQRVLSGSHFPSDVVAGWILGWAVARAFGRREREGAGEERPPVPARSEGS